MLILFTGPSTLCESWYCRSHQQSQSRRRQDRLWWTFSRFPHLLNLNPNLALLSSVPKLLFYPKLAQKITALLISKEANTFYISALLSLSEILAVASLKNSGKSMPPDWSSSSSAKIWYTNLFCPPKPNFINAYFNSCGSTVPLPSPSNMSNAIFMSFTYYTGMVNVA